MAASLAGLAEVGRDSADFVAVELRRERLEVRLEVLAVDPQRSIALDRVLFEVGPDDDDGLQPAGAHAGCAKLSLQLDGAPAGGRTYSVEDVSVVGSTR